MSTKDDVTECPRCFSTRTTFCYYNNKKETQPRYKCHDCKRKFTKGGKIRNVPLRKSAGSSGGGGSANGLKIRAGPGVQKDRRKPQQRKRKRKYEEEDEDEEEDVLFMENEEEEDESGSESEQEMEAPVTTEDEAELPLPVGKRTSRMSRSAHQDRKDETMVKVEVDQAVLKGPEQELEALVGPLQDQQAWNFKAVFDKIKKAILDGYSGIVYK